MRDVAIICGPTAAGKSAIAMTLARETGAVLISADSRQVYRGFDIGTAKPDRADRDAVRHLGIDIVDPTERYSAAAWSASALIWLDECEASGRRAIIVGGTGFYLKTLEAPLFESPSLDPVRRAALLAELDAVPTEELRRRCKAIDPVRAHLGRTQLLRALEIEALTGRPLSVWLTERARPPAVRAHYLLVDPGAVLRDRVTERVDAMLAAGWEREVAALASTVPADAPAWNACGYGALRAALAGAMRRDAAIERTVIDTRQYAKRQRTWFRHQLPTDRVTTLDPTAASAPARAQEWLHAATLTEHT